MSKLTVKSIVITTGASTLFPDESDTACARSFAKIWQRAVHKASSAEYPTAIVEVSVLWGHEAGQRTVARVDGDDRHEDSEGLRRDTNRIFDRLCGEGC